MNMEAQFKAEMPAQVDPVRQRVIQSILERIPQGLPACTMCGKKTGYGIADGVVHLILTPFGTAPALGGVARTQPCITLTCNTCGHTVLMNLLILGLGDLTAILPG